MLCASCSARCFVGETQGILLGSKWTTPKHVDNYRNYGSLACSLWWTLSQVVLAWKRMEIRNVNWIQRMFPSKKMVDFVRCSALLEAWTSQTSDKKTGLQFVSRSTRWSGQLTSWKSMGILKMTPSLYHGITGSSEPFTWGVFTIDAQGASWGEQHLEVFFKSSDFQVLFVATYLIWCPSTPSAKIVSLPTTALDGPREWNGQQHNWGHGTMVQILTKIQMTVGDG